MSRDQLLQKACYIYLGLNVLLQFLRDSKRVSNNFFSFVFGFYAEILKQQLKSFIYLTIARGSHKIYLPPELSLLLYCFLRYEVRGLLSSDSEFLLINVDALFQFKRYFSRLRRKNAAESSS